MKTLPVIFTGKSLTVVNHGKTYTLNRDNKKFLAAMEAWKSNDENALLAVLDDNKNIAAFTCGDVKIFQGGVTYKDQPIGNVLVERILQFAREGLPYEPMARFLNNLMQNPSQPAKDELYLFLETGVMPITDDGHFLAYRKVDNDYMSYHENPDGTKNRNRIKDVVTMDRNLCDPSRTNTCSRGLHFCAHSYLASYEGGRGRVMVVKVNPRDITAIPSDYNNTKGRCCRYEVVDEVLDGEKNNVPDKKPLATTLKRKSHKTKQRIKFVTGKKKKGKTRVKLIVRRHAKKKGKPVAKKATKNVAKPTKKK